MIAFTESPGVTARRAPAAVDRVAELQKTISASRLGLWLACRLKFYFRYVKQVQKPPTPAMHAGSTVHAVLQHWNRARWRREPFALERFQKLFGSYWTTLQQGARIPWEGAEDAERTSAWRALEHYFRETPIKADERPEAVEVLAEADLSPRGLPRLVGVLDLVRAGGRIVDFKVVGKSPDAQQVVQVHEVQLTCYSLLYREETGRKESALELHHLVKTKAPQVVVSSLPPATGSQHTRLFKQIESYLAGLARRDFVPSPGFHCAGCACFGECRACGGKEVGG